ncbi:MAG: phage holin family protein [Ilumatobacteraceae bacterium]
MTTTDRPDRALADARPNEQVSVGDVVDLVKTYAKQETIGPLRGAGKWLGMGAAGALLLGLGLVIVLLGVLRLIQTEWDRAATGALSWLSYLIVLVITVALLVIVLKRVGRDSLNRPEQD